MWWWLVCAPLECAGHTSRGLRLHQPAPDLGRACGGAIQCELSGMGRRVCVCTVCVDGWQVCVAGVRGRCVWQAHLHNIHSFFDLVHLEHEGKLECFARCVSDSMQFGFTSGGGPAP